MEKNEEITAKPDSWVQILMNIIEGQSRRKEDVLTSKTSPESHANSNPI